MFKYTPKKATLAELRKIRKQPWVANREYNFIRSLVGGNYTMYLAIWRWFDGFVFYSPTRLSEVPLNGVLMPLELFDVEEIKSE